MKVTASQVRPEDIVRGIGLEVVYSEPQDDSHTSLEGRVSTADPDNPGEYVGERVVVILPNDHLVNVRRADVNYRLDLIGWVGEAFATYGETGDDDELVEELTKIAGKARGIAADFDTTRYILGQLDPNAGDPNAAFVDAYLDAGEGAFGTQEDADADYQEGPHGY